MCLTIYYTVYLLILNRLTFKNKNKNKNILKFQKEFQDVSVEEFYLCEEFYIHSNTFVYLFIRIDQGMMLYMTGNWFF